MAMETKVRAFFAWQSDLPSKTNRAAIKQALERVSSELKEHGIDLYIDEATRDTTGSQNIPDLIKEKIEIADIFIGDVSTINNSSIIKVLRVLRYKQRKTPNPNVTFELGYAASELGWDRIILLFNENFGKTDDLPFDFDRHRLMRYFLSQSSDKGDRKTLTSSLKSGILDIVKANPLKPAQKRGMKPEELKRERDAKNLKWLLEAVHIPTLDEFIEGIPYKFNGMIFFFHDEFNGITNSNLFHISDKTLSETIKKLHDSWNTALSHEHLCNYDKKTNFFSFFPPPNRAFTKAEEKSIRAIERARKVMALSLKELQKIVREKYVEIDPSAASQEAIKSYRLFHEDLH